MAGEAQFADMLAQALTQKGLDVLDCRPDAEGLIVQYRRAGQLELRLARVNMAALCERLGNRPAQLLPAAVNAVLEDLEQQEQGPPPVAPGGCPWCGRTLNEGKTDRRMVPQPGGPPLLVREHVECLATRRRAEATRPKCGPCNVDLEPRPRGKVDRYQVGVMWCPECGGGYRV